MPSTSVFRGRDQESYVTRNVAGSANVTLSIDDARGKIISLTGLLTGNINVILPVVAEDAGLAWIVRNQTTGAFSLTVKTVSGTGIVIPQGCSCGIYTDGVNVLDLTAGASTTLINNTASGNTAQIFSLTHTYTNPDFPASSSNHPDYSVFELIHRQFADTANIANPFDLIWTGIRTHLQYGSATVLARGSEQTVTASVDVQGSASGDNELATFMGWQRAKAASGTPADGVASMWFFDGSLHGNLGAQSALLNGITMLVNSYMAAQPIRGPSSAAWFVTRPGGGAGGEDGHNVADTQTLDALVSIFGFAGDAALTTFRRGATVGLQIGEWGSGWSVVADDGRSWFGHGLSVRGGELSGIRVRDPHRNASNALVGSAILLDTADAALSWQWWLDAGSANAPLTGAIRLHDANSTTAGRIQWGSSVHAPAMYRSADGTLTARLPDASTGAKFHVHRTANSDPAFEVGGTDAVNIFLSTMIRNDSGALSQFVAGTANNFFTGSAAGDVGLRWDGDQVFAWVGGSAVAGGISGAGKWGVGALPSTARFYVRDDTNIELATFEGRNFFSSVFVRVGDAGSSPLAALRIYPATPADATNTLVDTGGVIMRGSFWTGSASSNVEASWNLLMISTTPTYVLTAKVGVSNRMWIAQDGKTTIGDTQQTTALANVAVNDTATTTVSLVQQWHHLSSGTPAAGFGGETRMQLESSTTDNRDAAGLIWEWATAADATRKARVRFTVYDTAVREAMRIEADGAAPMIGFLGATAIARPSVTGSRGGNAALASLLTQLAALGLITDNTTA